MSCDCFSPEWERIGPKGRKRWLLKFQDWILDNSEHIIAVLQSETGKTRLDASGEPPICADMLNYWAGNAEKFLADTHPKARNPMGVVKKLTTLYRPYPVVGVITPWNFPLSTPAWTGFPRWPPAPRCYSNPPKSRR